MESDLREPDTWSILACLGVSSRFRLVKALAVADRCVGELAEAVGLSQSCTTRHLQALERVGLVKGHREGRRVRFRLRAEVPGLRELLGWALPGTGLEALAAGGSPHCDQAVARLIATDVDRRTRPTGASRGRGRVGRAPMADSESADPAAPRDPGNSNLQRVAGSMRARRRDDLEDYLL